MPNTVISVEALSKSYQLGVISSGTFHGDLQRWWAKLRGLPDPHLKIGEKDHGNRDGETVWALKDINFQVLQGEALGIIGRNGAGKSTLLKILSRVTAPTSGEIKTKGKIASLLEVGTGFHPELTGRENIFMNGAIMGMDRREITRKFDEIVDFSGVETYIDTPVKRYSSGMYVRLAFAVAAHLDPDILIVDEVLAVGDAEFQKKCLGKMGDAGREGRTVLFVSHNMIAIKSLCKSAFLLDKGKIEFSGDADEAVDIYLKHTNRQASNRLWTDPLQAPGNDLVRIKSAHIVPQTQADTIDVHTPVDIEFEFWNYQETADLNYSLVLYTQDDVCVLNTASHQKRYSKGVIQGICHIPGDFLNAAAYRIQIMVVQNSRPIFNDKDVLSFEITEPLRAGNWFGKWIGVVRPRFEWTTAEMTLTPVIAIREKE